VATMYDLTVSVVHTFAVGSWQAVVHNCGGDSLESLAFEKDIDNNRLQNLSDGRNKGGAILRDENGNVIDRSSILYGHSPSGANGMHSENQVIGWLRRGAARYRGYSKYTLDVFSEQDPCSAYCANWIRSGAFKQEAQTILGASVDVRVHTRGSLFNPGSGNWHSW